MLLFISSMIKTPIYIRVPVQHTKNLCFNFNFTPELMENIEDGLTGMKSEWLPVAAE